MIMYKNHIENSVVLLVVFGTLIMIISLMSNIILNHVLLEHNTYTGQVLCLKIQVRILQMRVWRDKIHMPMVPWTRSMIPSLMEENK